MATDWKQKAKDLGEGWKKAQEALGIKNIDSKKDFEAIQNQMSKGPSNAQKAAQQFAAAQQPTLQTIGQGKNAVTYVSVPGDTAATMNSLVAGTARMEDRIDMGFLADQATILKDRDNTIRATESANQLAGVGLQADATRFAASESAGATRFAASEGARAAITTQQIASQSQERQIGLKGAQDRLLAVEQGAQERLNIGATGEQQRQTQAQLLAGQERQIGLTGEQQRLTQGQLLAGQERQIGLTGEQQRLTQAQLLAGQERQIGLTGEQQRLLAQEQGRQQRETEMQAEMNRRYKEAKDAADAARAFRS